MRLNPKQVAEATKPSRTPKQLANDARLRAGKKKSPDIFVKKNLLGPDDVDPHENRIDISTSGPATATRADIDIIAPEKMQAKAENEAYMNELVEIQIEADDDPNAPLFVGPFGHNGIPQYVERGKPQTIKRKFLYSAIAGKTMRLVSAFGKDANGMEYNRLSGPSRGTHRVVLITDTARGRADFMKWMAQA